MIFSKSKIYEYNLFTSWKREKDLVYPEWSSNILLARNSGKEYKKFIKYYITKGSTYWLWALHDITDNYRVNIIDFFLKKVKETRKSNSFEVKHFFCSKQFVISISISQYIITIFNVPEDREALKFSLYGKDLDDY